MRMMLRFQVPVEVGNDTIRNGKIGEILETVMKIVRPEATYFTTEDGKRTAYVFFDLRDPAQIPVIAEPLFQGMNASVHFSPVMTAEELQAGLAQLSQP
jgi:hypothetical protein